MGIIDYLGSIIEYDIKNGRAEIIKCNFVGDELILPDEIEGVKVTSIGRYGLSGKRELKKVILPRGLESIGNLAFYNDRGLEALDLPETLYRIGGDAFKNCDGIKNVVIRNDRMLKYVLDELSQELTVTFKTQADEIVWQLVFPVNAESFSEDVPGRAFHRTFSGPGYTYRRETVGREIGFKLYDRLFGRTLEEETTDTLSYLAFCRLAYPYKLDDTSKETYLDYLRENAYEAGKGFIERHIFGAVYYMIKEKLFSEAAADELLGFARSINDAETASMLMDYKLKNFGKKRKRFEL